MSLGLMEALNEGISGTNGDKYSTKQTQNEEIDYEDENKTKKKLLRGERVVLNVGGTKFETYRSTLTNYSSSLLGTMFHKRNSSLLKPDENV
jgi:hypothetical protein